MSTIEWSFYTEKLVESVVKNYYCAINYHCRIFAPIEKQDP
jgi:hypothetical protein